MKKNHRLVQIYSLVLTFLSSGASWAEAGLIQMGLPIIQGTGCSLQSSSAVLSPDGSELSIIYDDYHVGTDRSQQADRKTCTMVIPFKIPENYKLKITQADYRGFNSLPEKSSSEFLAEYSFQGENNKETRKLVKFRGPIMSEFYEVHRVHSKSPCSSQTQFVISTQLSIENKNPSQNAMLQIDTLDLTQPRKKKDRRTKFQLQLKKCSEDR
jgi:hypothetical protein